ncbi:MAG: efflux RND transporter permease subunit [Hahellaceae bacterium]|nr:efflux RND transporter permease subunit [Hahellaceae bacterium]MCP5170078.1 efflux RND transporter permease subunit [Hahellaceae bacterium]
MKLPSLALKNYQFTWMLVLMLSLLGWVSFQTMPRSEDPQFNFPSSLITVIYAGTDPMDMESQVVDVLEEALNELDDIDSVRSTIRDGVATLRVEFLYGSDPDDKYDEVLRSVNQARADLPENLQKLEVRRLSPTTVNIAQLALISESASYQELKYYAEKLESEIEKVPSIKESETWAYPEQQVEVALDLRKLSALGVSAEQIYKVISSSSKNLPAGYIYSGDDKLTVRTSGFYRSLQEVEATPVYAKNSQILHLKDVATVRLADAPARYLGRYNGERAVFVSAIQREGTQISKAIAGIEDKAARLATKLPSHIRLQWVFNQGNSVAKQIDTFTSNLGQGVIVVGLVLLLLLGIKPAIVAMVSIPLSIMIAIGWVDFAGFGLQQMTIVGLIIALGLLVDNAIVVVENIQRNLRQGMSRYDATVQGAAQVGWSITSGTVTTVLAFFPLLLLQSGSGTFMRSMPVTVVLTLTASLLLALTVVPLMSKGLLPLQPNMAEKAATRGFEWLNHYIYAPVLRSSLRHPWILMVICVALFGGSLLLVKAVGVSMFPKADKPQLLIDVRLNENSRLDRTNEVIRQVEQVVSRHPAVKAIASNIGNGNPRLYYNKMPKQGQANYGQLMVELETGSIEQTTVIADEIRTSLSQWPEADIKVEQFQQGPPYEAPIAIRVIGDDHAVIRKMAAEVEQVLRNTPDTMSVDNLSAAEMVTVKVQIKADKAALLGLTSYEMDQAVRMALSGMPAGTYRDQLGEDYTILVLGNHYNQPTSDEFDKILLSLGNGQQVPLGQIADIQLFSSQAQLQHYNFDRMALVTADVAEGRNVAKLTAEVIEKLKQLEWPEGVYWTAGGEEESRNKNFAGLGKALILSLLGIFAVLVLQFRSFLQPLIIFIAIPFAITGAIVALYLSGYSFSIMAFVGLNSLMGIVVNNSIILVDYANQRLLENPEIGVAGAIAESASTRLTPIVLTSLTTVGGLLPLTLQGGIMWAPMGWTIIGGLAMSTLLTLLLVPVLYQMLTRTAKV